MNTLSKKISEWKNVLVDTSFIIDSLKNIDKYKGNEPERERIIVAKDIMNFFDKDQENRKIPVNFMVTSITIGELKIFAAINSTKKILDLFNCGSAGILPYGINEAEIVRKIYYDYNSGNPNKLKNLEDDCKKNGFYNARNWINDDMKIIACAKRQYDLNRLDVILTADKNTFLPIAQKIGVPCVINNKEYFKYNFFDFDGELI